jgi:ribulose-5-phosphate 4-epimerase/fuculose-1-phosphate aldolase
MVRSIHKYARKLETHRLTPVGEPLIGSLDAELRWNRPDPRAPLLAPLFDTLDITSLLCARPAEPFGSIIDFLASRAGVSIRPNDTETRTFLHEIPVIDEFATATIAAALQQRRCVIVGGHGIVTTGTVTPEQAFVTFSSVCFSCFVKFFHDFAAAGSRRTDDREYAGVFEAAAAALPPPPTHPATLTPGPFTTEETVYRALAEAGKATVDYGLVDSYFGNISYLHEGTLYISQTSSSLDELAGCIDPCPLDGSSCAGITASSELSAHRHIVCDTGACAVLHGHPTFSVIMSMLCERRGCEHEGECHIACPYPRAVAGVPVVPGEVGGGPHGLCNTVPPAMRGNPGVIVYGHGVFTTGKTDFNEAFASLLTIEERCREGYFALIRR